MALTVADMGVPIVALDLAENKRDLIRVLGGYPAGDGLVGYDRVGADEKVDFSEWEALELAQQSGAISRMELEAVHAALLKKARRTFGVDRIRDFRLDRDHSTIRFTDSGGQTALELLFAAAGEFTLFGALKEALWYSGGVLSASLTYYATDNTVPLIYSLRTSQKPLTIASEIFSEKEDLPTSPAHFALFASQAMSWVARSDRREWVRHLTRPNQDLELQRAMRQSHPKFAGEFLSALLTPMPGESQADELKAITVAKALWSHLTPDNREQTLARAAKILSALPNPAHQALLLAPAYLKKDRIFDLILGHLSGNQAGNALYLLEHFELQTIPPKIPPAVFPDGIEWMEFTVRRQKDEETDDWKREETGEFLKSIKKNIRRATDSARIQAEAYISNNDASGRLGVVCYEPVEAIVDFPNAERIFLGPEEDAAADEAPVGEEDRIAFYEQSLKLLASHWKEQDGEKTPPIYNRGGAFQVVSLHSALSVTADGLGGKWRALVRAEGPPTEEDTSAALIADLIERDRKKLLGEGHIVLAETSDRTAAITALKPQGRVSSSFDSIMPAKEGSKVIYLRETGGILRFESMVGKNISVLQMRWIFLPSDGGPERMTQITLHRPGIHFQNGACIVQDELEFNGPAERIDITHADGSRETRQNFYVQPIIEELEAELLLPP